ncbi:MAG: EamA family transporter [Chloroflexi bacterium]|nr:EamA family transporter [Chloroflexota bacterium]
MSSAALGLVLLAAVAHASWNLLARRAEEKLAFLWCGTLATTVLFLPLGGWLLLTTPLPPAAWGVVAVSALLEALYYWTLAQAYRYGDLSLVYPIARGTAPVIVPLLAAVFLGERLSWLAAGGIGLVVVGTVVIHTRRLGWPSLGGVAHVFGQLGTRYALLTGVVIASYSSLDKYGVTLAPPLLYGYLLFAGLTVALIPLIRPRWRAVELEWRKRRGSIVLVGVLAPGSYGLVLLALTLAPVSYVAAAREISVVLAAILGAVVLREGYGPQRLLGSAAIAAGLMLLVG